MKFSLALLLAALLPAACAAETIKVATYNIENFREHFQAHKMTTQPSFRQPDEAMQRILDSEKNQNDEDNWEIATVIQAMNPDIMVIQEGCRQEDLEFFNERWLNKAYETLIVFPSNTERGQELAIILKPGFKVLDRRDQYYLEPDTVINPRGDRLFSRGPVFVLVQAPDGYTFWVGTNHQKSKSDNSLEVTQWRNREALRTRQIIQELAKDPRCSGDVVFLGDLNDEIGFQEFEHEGGGDTMANILGDGPEALHLATRPLAEKGEISFGGYWRSNRRSLIDHIVVTPAVVNQIEEVRVFREGLAPAASDHYPVFIRLDTTR